MDKQEKETQTKILMATGALKTIAKVASGKGYEMLSDAQRLKLISDTAQMMLDMWLEPPPHPK